MTKYKYYLKLINIYLLIMLFAFPIFPLKLSVIVILTFSFSSIINYFFVENVKLKFNYLLLFSIIFPLLYFINYLLYPESFDAWFEFEKRIALFGMPIIFGVTQIDINKSKLFFAYNLSVIILCLVVLIHLLFFDINETYFIGGLSYALRTTIEEQTTIHPTYFSLFTGFSFYIILNNLVKNEFLPIKFLLNIINLLILVVLLILLASKIFFLSTLLIIPLIIFKSRLKTLFKVGVICFFYLLFTLSMIFIPSLNQRLSELNFNKIEVPKNNDINSTNLRFGIYHCSFELLKNNFIWGIGTAKLQQELNKCYTSINITELLNKNYNTHNEYLNVWLSLGVFGILVFLSILILSFKKSKMNDEHYLFMFLFCIFCLTENLLSRQHGVFMFVIFNYYFLFPKTKQVKLSD